MRKCCHWQDNNNNHSGCGYFVGPGEMLCQSGFQQGKEGWMERG